MMCRRCRRKDTNWDQCWWVSDKEWKEVVPESYQNKTICPRCFIELAEEKGIKYKIKHTSYDGVYRGNDTELGVEKGEEEND